MSKEEKRSKEIQDKPQSDLQGESQGDSPEVYALKQNKSGWQFSRRDFLVASSAAVAALAAAGCSGFPGSGQMNWRCLGMKAHLNGIQGLWISPDGKYMLSESLQENVKLWALPEGRLVNSISAHYPYYAMLLNSNGSFLAASDKSKTISLYSLTDGSLLHSLKGHTHWATEWAFSPDGSLLVSSGYDQTIRLWSLPDGTLQKTIDVDCDIIQNLLVSPDSRFLAAKVDSSTALLYSLPEGELLARLEGHEGQITNTQMLFSPNSTLLATGSQDDETIKLWSLPDGKLINTLEGFKKGVRMTFNAQGTVLVAGNGDGALWLWSLPDGELIKTLAEDGYYYQMAVSADGSLLAAAINNCFKIWSLPDGELQITANAPDEPGSLRDLAFSPDGEILAAPQGKLIHLFSPADGSLIKSLKGHEDSVEVFVFSPDGSLLVSGDDDGTLKTWSMPEGELVSCPLDLKCMSADTQAITYEATGEDGSPISLTLPCGSPLPEGAICTCNCVSGTHTCSCVSHSSGGSIHYWHPD